MVQPIRLIESERQRELGVPVVLSAPLSITVAFSSLLMPETLDMTEETGYHGLPENQYGGDKAQWKNINAEYGRVYVNVPCEMS